MLEAIRQFAEEQLMASGEAAEARNAHARYFAGREADVIAVWDSPRQRAAYDWFTIELANLRTAFRWAADQRDLDVAVTIATYAAFLGLWVERYEPIAWAEELIEPARTVDHPRLAYLYVTASQCCLAGRPEAALRYSSAGQTVVSAGRGEVPFGLEEKLGAAFVFIGQPERAAEWCRTQLARGRDTHTLTWASLVLSLAIAGNFDEAQAAVTGLIDAAEETRNPHALSYALLARGFAYRDSDPVRALEDMRRGLVIAQDSGNRANESHVAGSLCRLEADHGDPLAALDYFSLSIRNYRDSGDTTSIRVPLAILAGFLDRIECHESAAIAAGFAFDRLTAAWVPEISTTIAHLREVLGDRTYESLARKGETMTTAAIVTYAYDQIDQARSSLTHPG
ncbi:hypothetical protein [Mycolicibacterium xanthum]|uniref:hypothetical protein n=1 Tax=Mycolicibacterium xanthum TaxID=2796469 RepID=UPI0027DF6EC1|nr:hypothetical protein [Mycolicibacterium xanthum]